MIGDAYATVQEYRAAIGKETSDDDLALSEALLVASRWWERKLHRPAGFNRDTAAVARTFYVHRGTNGEGSKTLFVDDIAATTGMTVTLDGEAVAAADYQLRPLNALVGPEAEPYDRIVRLGTVGWTLQSPIVVTAIWGWPAVPEAIKAATIEWAAIWRGESVRATERVNEMDQVASASPYHLSQLKRITEAYQQARPPMAVVLP